MLTHNSVAREITERDINFFADLYVHRLMNLRQKGSIHAHSTTHLNTIEQRLTKLCRAGYIAELKVSRGDDPQYMLLQKGMDVLTAERDYPDRTIYFEEPSKLFRDHDLHVTDVTISMALSTIRCGEPATLIDQYEIISRAVDADVRANNGWRTSLSHPQHGVKKNFLVKPDKVLGYYFPHRPMNKNVRYYVIEVDRSTMALKDDLQHASILRKLLAFERTFQDAVLKSHFSIWHPYFLFFTTSIERRNHMASLAQREVVDDDAAKAMLFAVQPPPPSYSSYTKMTDIEWIDGRCVQRCFPM